MKSADDENMERNITVFPVRTFLIVFYDVYPALIDQEISV